MNTPLRILAAVEEPEDASRLQRALAKAGVTPVYCARDGQEVLDYLQGHPPFENPVRYPLPNLVLIDLKALPFDSYAVLEWVREQPNLRSLLVAVLNSSDEPEDINRAYASGANSYIVKPEDPSELVSVVERLKSYWLKLNAPGVEALAVPKLMPL